MHKFLFYNKFIIFLYMFRAGTAVTQWLRCCATNWEVAGSIPAGVSGFFIDIKSFRSHYGPGVDSASNRLTTLPPSCAVVTKSGNLNFLEPSGPVQACNGTTLHVSSTMCDKCRQQTASPVHCTTSCKHSLVLLRMGEIIARNMLSWLKSLINCYCCI